MRMYDTLRSIAGEKRTKVAAALLVSGIGLSACGAYTSGPASPSASETVLQGLVKAGFTSPEFTITDPRKEFTHTDIHVDILVEGCSKSVDTPVLALTTQSGVVWEPVTEGYWWQHLSYISPSQFEAEHHC